MEFLSLSNKKKRCKNARNYLTDWKADSRSKFQTEVKKFLRGYWQHNIVFEEFPIVGTRLTLDFYNANKKIAIEVSPDEYHVNFNPWLHKNRQNFLNKVKSDDSKREWCIRNNIKLVELFNENIGNLSVDFFLKEYNISL